jgi:hypothetical protein
MTTNDIMIYAHECEIYAAGACNWKSDGGDFQSPTEDGKPMSPSKCIFAEAGIYAGKHPASCIMRDIALSSRQSKAVTAEVIANTG